ncbi:hypothetical protein [Streptomyces misionensis]|uniref:hypothetical protein n=1 Tax=Streptomyces misionensis TaxID=67331 RepID=UPI003BB07AF2
MVDDDLSCRALGLLTRWLRRPPGAEIDSIPDMVKRAKRDGKERLEGRDALYAASYELEEAGYLVRELASGEGGQHEWVVRIYNRPVEPSRRSNPDDRKRGSKRGPRTKPQVSPITGFQESAVQESAHPDSAQPDSADPDSSSKDSQKDSSLSGPTGLPGAGAPGTGEREAAAPEVSGADVVVDAYVRALGRPLVNGSRERLRGQAVQLLAAGYPVAWLAARAAEMPANGWRDLVQHAETCRMPIPGQAGPADAAASGGEGDGTPEQVAALRARIAARGSGL